MPEQLDARWGHRFRSPYIACPMTDATFGSFYHAISRRGRLETCAGACEQRDQNARHEHQAGRVVSRHAGGKRRLSGIGLREPARLGARHEVMTTAVAPASGRGIDEAWVDCRELFVAKAEFFSHTRTEVVDARIGGGDRRPDRGDALRGF